MTLYARWISEISVDVIPDQIFTGGPREPAIIVRSGSDVLKKNVDYTVDYGNNSNIGKATAEIRFIGNYLGTEPIAVQFNIIVSSPTPTPTSNVSPTPTSSVSPTPTSSAQPTPTGSPSQPSAPLLSPSPTGNSTPTPTNNGGGNGGSSGKATPSPSPTAANPSPTSNKPSILFDDVYGHWAEDEIYDMVERGIAEGMGDGTFAPNRAITRAEMVKMLAIMSGDPLGGREPFLDVSIGDWHAPYIAWGWNKGVVKGYDAITFSPNQTITRQEMITMTARYLQYKGIILPEADVNFEFADKANISDWAADAVEVARKTGLAEGFYETFGRRFFYPNEYATRAEAVVILLRILS